MMNADDPLPLGLVDNPDLAEEALVVARFSDEESEGEWSGDEW